MEKTLVLGRAGAGKTRLVMEEIARRVRAGTDAGALLLVPTYGRGEHLKRALLSLLEGEEPVLPDRSIVTFTSLAERVLGGTAINALATPGARDHRLRRALAAVDAPVFRKVAGFAGFRERFLGLVKEVKEAGLGAEETERALEDLLAATEGSAARARLEGFVEVFRSYGGILAGDRLMDHEDFQRNLLEQLRAKEEGKGAAGALRNLDVLLVDGFTNFTALQLEVVDLLAERSAEAVVTLPDDPDRPDLCLPCRDTRERFLAGGWRPRRLGEPRRFAAGDLRRVEATIFDDAVPEPAPADGSVLLLRCADPADEADRVARRAALWIRRDGWRPEEILLVWRSLSGVRPLLEEAFARHGVPLRVFVPRPLAPEPVVRAAADLLRLALGAGDGEGALRAARSGYVRGTDPAEGDRLAAELERRGVPGEAAAVLAAAGELGLERTAALLHSLLPADPAAAARPRAPRALALEALSSFDAKTRLLPEWERERHDEGRAAVEASALSALGDLVSEVARGMAREGAASLAPAAFLAAVEEALGRAAFQPLDRRLHAVNAVDVVEARQWEARGVVVGGLLEKRFPRAPREDLFLRDRERRRANEAGGLRFAERLRAREEERLYFHVACTRARERLVLSWPAAGAGGERLLPSSFLDEVLRLWPADALPVSESRLSDPAPLACEVLSTGDLLRGALVRVAAPVVPGSEGERGARGAGALVFLLAARGMGGRLAAVARAASLAAAPVAALRGRRLRARFLRPFRTSASALSDLHQCAYKHFASRLLGLRSPERDAEEGLDPLRLGTLVHGTLEEWLKGGRRRDPGAIFDERLAATAAGARPGLGDRATAVRAREAVAAFARAEGVRIDRRLYVPSLFEHPFGMVPGGTPALRFAAGRRRVEVRGVFDRVDLAPGEGPAVIVDYKMRWKEEPYDGDRHEEALAGKDPQVPLYWLALRDALGREPAGVEIAEVGTLAITGLRAASADGGVAPDGAVVLDAAGDDGLRARLEEMLAGAVGALGRGEIPARPVDEDRCGAGACDFADLCRYEKWRRG